MDTVEFLSKLAQELALAFLPILAAVLIRWVKVKGDQVIARIEAEQPDTVAQLRWITALAVKAAEQAGAAGFIKNKKQYAVSVIQAYLDAKGLEIDAGLISAAIEAAVHDEFNKYPQIEPGPEG